MTKTSLFSLTLLLTFSPSAASGATLNDISHIHNIKVIDRKIFFGTHEGLVEYRGNNQVIDVGKDRFDVMGLTTLGATLYASGHPGPDSKLLQPVGLVKSEDAGKTWKKISLQGKVDFHLLEVTKSEIYGGDSTSGNLYYSNNLGKSWTTQGRNYFSDIAPNPTKVKSGLGIRDGALYSSNNAFLTSKVLKNSMNFSNIDWSAERLLAASGKELLLSKDSGIKWKTLSTFTENIGVISQSAKLIIVTSGNTLQVSSDGGKNFVIK